MTTLRLPRRSEETCYKAVRPDGTDFYSGRVPWDLPAYEVLGPNGAAVAAFLELLPTLTGPKWDAVRDADWYGAWYDAKDTAWDVAWNAAWDAGRHDAWVDVWDDASDDARDNIWDVAWYDAVWDAARALMVRDLITTEQFEILTAPMRAVGVDFDTLTATENLLERENK